MSWFILFTAGLLEVVWAVGLKYTEGFSKPLPSLIVIVAIVLSMFLLGVALKSLPVSSAYAIWVGIGIVGVSIFGVLFYQEPLSVLKAVCILTLLLSILGLKVAS